jgi:hypothetical protein
MKWSFDNLHIGLIKKDGRSLATREIKRPPGMVNGTWFQHAAEVCRVLNKDGSRPRYEGSGD